MTSAEKIALLGRCAVFAGTPATELALLAEMMRPERLRAGEILFAAGEFSDRVFVIVRGRLQVTLPGQSAPIRALGEAELLGEYAMFSNLARTATVTAETESQLLSLDYTRFRAFLVRYPESTLVLLKTTIDRLIRAESHS